jgi:hypothetical protein
VQRRDDSILGLNHELDVLKSTVNFVQARSTSLALQVEKKSASLLHANEEIERLDRDLAIERASNVTLRAYEQTYGPLVPSNSPNARRAKLVEEDFMEESNRKLTDIAISATKLQSMVMKVLGAKMMAVEQASRQAAIKHSAEMTVLAEFAAERVPGSIVTCFACETQMPITSPQRSTETDWPFDCKCVHDSDKTFCKPCLYKHINDNTTLISCPWCRFPLKENLNRAAKRHAHPTGSTSYGRGSITFVDLDGDVEMQGM